MRRLALDFKILQQSKKRRNKGRRSKSKKKSKKRKKRRKMRSKRRKERRKTKKIRSRRKPLINLPNQSKIKSHAHFVLKSWQFQSPFSLVITDFVEAVSLNLSTARRTLVFSVGNKLQLLLEMLPLQALLMIISKPIQRKREIQRMKRSRKRKVFLDFSPSTFRKRFMERLLRNILLRHLFPEEVEEEERQEWLRISVLLTMMKEINAENA